MKFKIIIAAMFALVLLMPYAASAQREEEQTETEELEEYMQPDEETLLSWPFTEDISYVQDTYVSRLEPEGRVWHDNENGVWTFISGDEFGETITDVNDTYSLALNYLEDSDSDLAAMREDVYGDLIVYTFQQSYDDKMVYNSYLKIITNNYGEVLGAVSSLERNPEDVGWDYEAFREPADWEERFSDWDSEIFEKTVTAVSEEIVDVSIPVLVDPDTGERYLGDKERLIFCVDTADIRALDDRQDSTPINMDRDLSSDGELLTYYLFIQVYDYFAEKGWWGPDGQRTPCMLQFDISGENRGNASYGEFQDGFHIFSFSIDDGAGQSLQVIAHEFTHGVSSTNHIGQYENETGALDEALSDLIGNTVEADIRQWSPSENPWLNGFRRAHKYQHALYAWDEFYTPFTDHPDDWNDEGNVHDNSHLISILAWRMYEIGMTPRDVFDFWFTFDLTLTPKTDFAETAMKAAWCAEIAGLSEYAPAMQQAVEDLKLDDNSLPEYLKDHQGMIVYENPLDEVNVKAVFFDPLHDEEFATWPAAGTNKVAAVFGEGTCWVVFVQTPEEDNLVVWNSAEKAWESADTERLTEIVESCDSDYYIEIFSGGTITELGE
ncbi:MAG: M4 family metallopeptidase [Anaerolineaceae bacterium]|nr:M4 family metallopeptidase [Anaerolineaceae bacterium]